MSSHKRIFAFLVIAISIIALSSATPSSLNLGRVCTNQLAGEISTVINRPEFKYSRWGIQIKSSAAQTRNRPPIIDTLYSYGASETLIPDSNTKLFTGAAAFLKYSSNFKFVTNFIGRADVNVEPKKNKKIGSLADVLCVAASGDPTITSSDIAEVARTLQRNEKINTVKTLYIDDSIFDQTNEYPSSWKWSDLSKSPSATFIVNKNQIELTVRPATTAGGLATVSIKLPEELGNLQIINKVVTGALRSNNTLTAEYVPGAAGVVVRGSIAAGSAAQTVSVAAFSATERFSRILKYFLQAEGINVLSTQFGACPVSTPVVATIESAPINTLLDDMLCNSNNIYAESFLKRLGVDNSGISSSSIETGLSSVKSILKNALPNLANLTTVSQRDGSGVSADNRVTPAAVVSLLEQMSLLNNADQFKSFFPVAGSRGTLAERLAWILGLRGVVRADSGSQAGVGSLSGYFENMFAPDLIFSIIVNSEKSISPAVQQDAIDDVVDIISRWRDC